MTKHSDTNFIFYESSIKFYKLSFMFLSYTNGIIIYNGKFYVIKKVKKLSIIQTCSCD